MLPWSPLRFAVILVKCYCYAPRKISGEHIVAALSVRASVRPSVSPYVPFVSGPLLRYLKSDFKTFLQKWPPCLDNVSRSKLGPYPEGQGHSATLQKNRVRPITLLFEVGFWKYFTEMITIMGQRVARNIWVATLWVKVTVWSCSKIVSGP